LGCQVFINKQFLTDYCMHQLPTRFTAASYTALLSCFIDNLGKEVHSSNVVTEIIHAMVIPLTQEASKQGTLQDILVPALLDNIFETISNLQSPAKLQRVMSNVCSSILWLHLRCRCRACTSM
jgi:hypothetical protein